MLSRDVYIILPCCPQLVSTNNRDRMISGLYTVTELQHAIRTEPERWQPLVFTNGCFDLLHAGHVRYLQAAKAFGRALVVGLNSDRSVGMIKPQSPGLPPRPIVPELQRAEVLAALKAVDGVVIFAEQTANELITALQPDVYVKGGDYTLSTLPEAQIIHRYGGRVELIQIEVPSSTSAIVQRIIHSAQPLPMPSSFSSS